MYRTWYTPLVTGKPKFLASVAVEAQGRQGKRVPAIFFRTEAGGEPVRDWLKSLPSREDRKRIGEDVKTVEFGWPIGMPVCKPLGDGIYEVRTSLAQHRIARVLFYIDKKNQGQASKGAPMKVRKSRSRRNHSGSTFDDFLEEEGIREEVEAAAIKRVLAWQLKQSMLEQQKTKQALARQLRTSRSQLDRLLDPRNVSVTLDTITRAARALGKRLIIRVADVKAKRA
jgi:hypothetical protein